MKIGLDYDDVIVDSSEILSVAALEIYNIRIPAVQFRFQENKVLNALLYGNFENLKEAVYSSPVWLKHTQLIPGAREGIHALLAANHDLSIVTNRSPLVASMVARDLEDKLGFVPLNFRFMGRKVSKRSAVEELRLEVFVDDGLKKLIDLRGLPFIKHLICFTGRLTSPDIKAIDSWPNLIDFFNTLAGETSR